MDWTMGNSLYNHRKMHLCSVKNCATGHQLQLVTNYCSCGSRRCCWQIAKSPYMKHSYTSCFRRNLCIWFVLHSSQMGVVVLLINRNESGRFGALKSDSTHHFFRNACTKSGSLRFHSFPVVDWFCLFI